MTERKRERERKADRREREGSACAVKMKAKETISKQQSVWDKAMRLVVYPRGAIKVEPAKRLIEKGWALVV